MTAKYDPRLDSHPTLSDSFEFRYSGQRPKRGLDATCQVRIFERIGKPRVVVLTELPGNEGMSVTNAVEMIIADLRQAFELPAETVWIEHYTDRRDHVNRDDTWDENFSLVTIGQGNKPTWKYLTREGFFQMLEGEATSPLQNQAGGLQAAPTGGETGGIESNPAVEFDEPGPHLPDEEGL